MIKQLGDMLPDFGGASTHARCFLHTTNLVAKALIKVFDVKPKKHIEVIEGAEISGDDDELNAESEDEARLVRELQELSKDIEHEDFVTLMERNLTDEEKNDDVDSFVDEIELLTDSEHQELLRSIRPIRLALVKVR